MNELDSIISKVQKLLAKADPKANPSEHEREQAMSLVADLLAKHNLDMATVNGAVLDEQPLEVVQNFGTEKWIRTLLSAVCKPYYVSLLFLTYKIENGRNRQRPVFVGTKENIAVAADMAEWLMKSINFEARKRFSEDINRKSFKLGAAIMLYKRAEAIVEAQKQPQVKGTGLIVLRNALEKQNEDYLTRQHPDLKTMRPRSSKVSRFAYEEGRTYGNSVNLGKQIGGTGTKQLTSQ